MGVTKTLLHTVYGGGGEAVATVERIATDWREMLEQSASEIEELRERVPQWIPVTERLPEELSRVLAVTAERGITIAWCRRERLGDLVWATLDDHYGETVTHWMPLPEPPEKP